MRALKRFRRRRCSSSRSRSATSRRSTARPTRPLVQLLGAETAAPVGLGDRTYAEMATPAGLKEIARYADGVGPSKDYIVPRDATGRSLAADHVRQGRPPGRPRRPPVHVPQRERVPAARAAQLGRPGGLRQRVRRVRAVLRARRRRPVLRQLRHRGRGARGLVAVDGDPPALPDRQPAAGRRAARAARRRRGRGASRAACARPAPPGRGARRPRSARGRRARRSARRRARPPGRGCARAPRRAR